LLADLVPEQADVAPFWQHLIKLISGSMDSNPTLLKAKIHSALKSRLAKVGMIIFGIEWRDIDHSVADARESKIMPQEPERIVHGKRRGCLRIVSAFALGDYDVQTVSV
jgi:hypothetical protein